MAFAVSPPWRDAGWACPGRAGELLAPETEIWCHDAVNQAGAAGEGAAFSLDRANSLYNSRQHVQLASDYCRFQSGPFIRKLEESIPGALGRMAVCAGFTNARNEMRATQNEGLAPLNAPRGPDNGRLCEAGFAMNHHVKRRSDSAWQICNFHAAHGDHSLMHKTIIGAIAKTND